MASYDWPPIPGAGATGTVTSVALADGSTVPIYSISGSPVTTAGTLTFTLATQTANKVFASATSGGAAQPAFRALVAADLPLTFGNLTDAGTDGIVVTGGTGAVIGSGTSLAQHVADTTHNGYLSSTDWNTFNGKQAALTIGNLTDAGTDGITVTGGTGAIIGSGTSIAQHVADTTHNGYLSSTDWNTFNGKGAGSVTSVALSVPATSIFGVTGSPVTTTGTLGLTTTGTSGGIPYFSSTSQLASSALLTASQLIIGGGAGVTPASLAAGSQYVPLTMGASAPGYTALALDQSAATSGLLLVARGGTGLASGTSGGILGYTASGTLASSGALTANQLIIGGGAGTTPASLAAGSQYVPLTMGASSPGYTALALDQTVATSGTLPVSRGGTGLSSQPSNGQVLRGVNSVLAASNIDHAYDMENLTLACTVSGNALTIAIKDKAGSTPSATSPVYVSFGNATIATGDYSVQSITAANTLVISSGSTLGTSNSVAFRFWVVLFNDAGTLRLGAVNCLSGTNIYPLRDDIIASSTAEGGAGGADSAQVIYTGTAVTTKALRVLGYLDYGSGLATAGTYASAPTKVRLLTFGVSLPGEPIQTVYNSTGATATGSTVLPLDDTIPQNTEGDQFLTQAITPTAAPNILTVESQLVISNTAGVQEGMALFQDSTANALAASLGAIGAANAMQLLSIWYRLLAGTTSSTTMNIRAGAGTGTTRINGQVGRLYGGVMSSWIKITEIMG